MNSYIRSLLLLLFASVFFLLLSPPEAEAQCTPLKLTEKGSLTDASTLTGTSIDSAGNYIYVTRSDGITIIDATDPNNLSEAATLSSANMSGGIVKVAGNYAYVLSGNNFTAIDVSDPNNPSELDTFTLSGSSNFGINGNYAYVTDGAGDDITVINISNPSNMTQADFLSGISAGRIAFSGNYAFVSLNSPDATNDGIASINITDPTNISVANSLISNSYFTPGSVQISGNYVYFTARYRDNLVSLDISNPASLVEADVFTDATFFNSISGISGLIPYNSYLIGENYDQVRLIDITDPTNMGHASGFYIPGTKSISLSGNYLSVFFTNSDKVTVYEISSFGGGGGSLGSCSQAGQWKWDDANSLYAFCDGTNWVAMSGSGTAGSCSTAGQFYYDSGEGNYVYCDGSNVVPTANNGAGTGCADALSMEYDNAANILKWCNGSNWIDMSGTMPAPATPKCVFLTSQTYKGNFGGVAAGDAACNSLASTAGIPGTFKAWVATSASDDPESTFTRSTAPYVDTRGVEIAGSWTDLTDGNLTNTFSYDEFGEAVAAGAAWTGVAADGTFTDDTCSSWGSGGGGAGTTTEGSGGDAGSTTNTLDWSDIPNNNYKCGSSLYLYCFQQ